MVKVRWDEKIRLPPRDSIPFFRKKPERFLVLKCKGTTEVPRSLLETLNGLVEDPLYDWERPESVTEKRFKPARLYQPYEG